jgi:putative flippase GtrA
VTLPSGDLFRFIVVGGAGFIADAGVLLAIVTGGGDPYAGRLASFALAVTLTWWLNRIWTFRADRRPGKGGEYAAYVLVQCGGFGVNYTIFAAAVSTLGQGPDTVVAALALGSVAGLFVNFAGARWLVYRRLPAGAAGATKAGLIALQPGGRRI